MQLPLYVSKPYGAFTRTLRWDALVTQVSTSNLIIHCFDINCICTVGLHYDI